MAACSRVMWNRPNGAHRAPPSRWNLDLCYNDATRLLGGHAMKFCSTCGQHFADQASFERHFCRPQQQQKVHCAYCGGRGTVPTPMGYEKCYRCGGSGWQ